MLDIAKYQPIVTLEDFDFGLEDFKYKEKISISTEGFKDTLMNIIRTIIEKIKAFIDFLFKRNTVKKLEEENRRLALKISKELEKSVAHADEKEKYEKQIMDLQFKLQSTNTNLKNEINKVMELEKELENKKIIEKRMVEINFTTTISNFTLNTLGLENAKEISVEALSRRFNNSSIESTIKESSYENDDDDFFVDDEEMEFFKTEKEITFLLPGHSSTEYLQRYIKDVESITKNYEKYKGLILDNLSKNSKELESINRSLFVHNMTSMREHSFKEVYEKKINYYKKSTSFLHMAMKSIDEVLKVTSLISINIKYLN